LEELKVEPFEQEDINQIGYNMQQNEQLQDTKNNVEL